MFVQIREVYDVGVWKTIRTGSRVSFKVRDERWVKF